MARMPDTFVIYNAAGAGIDGPQPTPFTLDELSAQTKEGNRLVRYEEGDPKRMEVVAEVKGGQWLRPDPELGAAQQAAFDAAMAGRSVLISGPGGVGKSEVTKRIVAALRAQRRTVAVTGSTGMAAVNIGGVTIHSALGTGRSGNIAEAQQRMGHDSVGKAQDRVGHVDTILIDEVSMLHGDYLDMADWWLNLVRGCGKYKPFGGVQMIFVGDFLQLPPVIRASDKVNRKYAFLAEAWAKLDPAVFLLKRNYRQTGDSDFRLHLNRVRRGAAPEDTLAFFNERLRAKLPGGVEPTRLFPTNREVDRVNAERLEALEGEEWSVDATYEGHPKWVEALKENMPCLDPLVLKEGAEVVCLRNHKSGWYVNGSRGTVVSMDSRGVVVRLRDGIDVTVERDTWEMKDASDRVLASVEQFPLKLAWALSIHKSQGQTLDEMELDPRGMFERGQCYTALSRVRTIEGLRLLSPLRDSQIRASKIVVEWYKRMAEQAVRRS